MITNAYNIKVQVSSFCLIFSFFMAILIIDEDLTRAKAYFHVKFKSSFVSETRIDGQKTLSYTVT